MDAHEREAAAAAEGMQEIYGRHTEHAVGDTVTFKLVGWLTPKVGQVEGVSSGNQPRSVEYLVRSGDRTWLVMPGEILIH
jgi:hypothetical protein